MADDSPQNAGADESRRERIAELLRAYRARSGLSLAKLAKRIDPEMNAGTIHLWEKGTPINPAKLGELVRELSLSPDEAKKFILLVRPDIIDPKEVLGEKWLERKISEHDGWQKISLPALDTEWLDAQPPSSAPKAGIYLHALQLRAKLTQDDLAAIYDVHVRTISNWQLHNFPPTAIDIIAEHAHALHLTEDNIDRLRTLVSTAGVVKVTGPTATDVDASSERPLQQVSGAEREALMRMLRQRGFENGEDSTPADPSPGSGDDARAAVSKPQRKPRERDNF